MIEAQYFEDEKAVVITDGSQQIAINIPEVDDLIHQLTEVIKQPKEQKMTRSAFDVVHGYLVGVASCSQCRDMYRVSGSTFYCKTIEDMLGIKDNPTEDAQVRDDCVCNLFIHWRS
jgi:hypothetical protein